MVGSDGYALIALQPRTERCLIDHGNKGGSPAMTMPGTRLPAQAAMLGRTTTLIIHQISRRHDTLASPSAVGVRQSTRRPEWLGRATTLGSDLKPGLTSHLATLLRAGAGSHQHRHSHHGQGQSFTRHLSLILFHPAATHGI